MIQYSLQERETFVFVCPLAGVYFCKGYELMCLLQMCFPLAVLQYVSQSHQFSTQSLQVAVAVLRYMSQSPRLFPDASLVKASAPESRSATQVAPLEISDS